MTIYSTDKLVAEARKLATEYRRTTGKPLGISSEIAEFDAARILNLDLIRDRSVGYDAIGKGTREGKRIQIKGRAVFDEKKSGQRIGHVKSDQPWDLLVLVIMNEAYEPVEVYECDRETLLKEIDESNKNKRGAMSLAKFKIIARLAWSQEKGLIEATDEKGVSAY